MIHYRSISWALPAILFDGKSSKGLYSSMQFLKCSKGLGLANVLLVIVSESSNRKPILLLKLGKIYC